MTWWQPISTAPRILDEPIDLWVVPGRPLMCTDRGKPFRVADAHLSGNGKYWLKNSRWIEGRHSYSDDGDRTFDPDDRGPDATIVTHWMKPPEPPGDRHD